VTEIVLLNDVTLREGVQVALREIGPRQKADIGLLLEQAGVRQLQVGYPGRSELDRQTIGLLKAAGCRACLEGMCSLGGDAWAAEIAAAVAAGADRLILIFPTADYRLNDVLHITREQCVERIRQGVSMAAALGVPVAFAPVEGSRTGLEFMLQALDAATEAGADRFYLVDTVGVLYPRQTREMVAALKAVSRVPLAIHAHNDFGAALANSLAAVEAGIDIVDVSVAGLGKRGGNAALEQLALALHQAGSETEVRLEMMYGLTRQVTEILGVVLPPSQPLVGASAFDFEVDSALRGTSAHTVVSGIPPSLVGHPGSVAQPS
jgi:2-isopropylmalate synthase